MNSKYTQFILKHKGSYINSRLGLYNCLYLYSYSKWNIPAWADYLLCLSLKWRCSEWVLCFVCYVSVPHPGLTSASCYEWFIYLLFLSGMLQGDVSNFMFLLIWCYFWRRHVVWWEACRWPSDVCRSITFLRFSHYIHLPWKIQKDFFWIARGITSIKIPK